MRVMAKRPVQALLWLVPGGLAGLVLSGFLAPTVQSALSLAIAALGLLPCFVVDCWETIKFRSHDEVQRTRTDYRTMLYATLFQLLSLAFLAFHSFSF